MTNMRVWPTGLAFNDVPGSANLTTLDILTSQSINGFVGGTWAPVSPIIIGGAGFRVTGPATLDDMQASTLNGILTANQPIRPTGIDGHVVPKFQTIGAPSGPFNLDDLYDTHSIGNPTLAVDATVTYTGGGLPRLKRIYTRAKPLAFDITLYQTALVGILAVFPNGQSKCWIELLYNGLVWEVAGYGGGTIV
jgi:hypothetical protein